MSKKIFDENGNEIKKPFYKKVIFWIVAVVVVYVAACSLFGTDSNDSSDSSSSSKSSSSAKTSSSKKSNKSDKEVIKTTPEDVIAMYQNKTSAQADDYYKGKITQVTGHVLDVKGGTMSGHDVTIDAGKGEDDSDGQTLTFHFSNSNKEEALSIQPGSTITVQGKFDNATIVDWQDNSTKLVSDVAFDGASLVK